VRKTAAKNILMKDGSAKRLPASQCEELLNENKARRFISNTVYRALKLGIEVKDPGTRDEKGHLAALVKAARAKTESKKQQKSEAEADD